MAYYQADLTGEDPLYRQDSRQVVIFKNLQRVEFPVPVFKDSISITQLGTINVVLDPLQEHWVVQNSDIADTEMGACQLEDADFDATLVNAIIISKAWVEKYTIDISYQQLYPVQIKAALMHNQRLDITPDSLAEMIQDLHYVKALVRPISDISASVSGNAMALEPDPHMENPNNFIEDEEHEVNVFDDKITIYPHGGSFFEENFAIRLKDNPDPLSRGVDYILVGENIEKIKTVSITSTVYDCVQILREYQGKVIIDYHAYGNVPTLYDIKELKTQITNIGDYIKESTFLTSTNLGSSPIIKTITTKLNTLEDNMRQLYEATPSYGDVTSGRSTSFKMAATDSDIHWYSIASLYTVDGVDAVVTADAFRFRMSTLRTKFLLEAVVNVNRQNINDPMVVDVLSANYPKGFIPFEDYSEVEMIIRPQLRIIYNISEVNNSGVILQLGFPLKGITDETVAIEDLSGRESAWKLIMQEDATISPNDDVIELPNSNHIYDSTNPDSRSITTLMPFNDGFLIWAGSTPLNRPDGGYKSILLDHHLEKAADITRMTKIRAELKDASGKYFPIDMPLVQGSSELNGTVAYPYNNTVGQMFATIKRQENDSIYIKLESNIISAESAQLDLRQVFVYF